MSVPSSSILPTLDAEAIGPLLSACRRCRRLRRKCDTQLPRCRMCEKSHEECSFVDGVTGQTVSRAHIQTLIERLKQLRLARDEAKSSNSPPTGPPAISFGNPYPATGHTPCRTHLSVEKSPTFDVLIPLTGPSAKFRWWGSSSVFALSNQVVQHACLHGYIPRLDSSLYDCVADPPDHNIFERKIRPAPVEDVKDIITLYMQTINQVYTFLDEVVVASDLQAYLHMKCRSDFSINGLRHDEMQQFFRISLMCAIACATEARHRPSRVAESLGYYNEALLAVEFVTSQASPASLQVMLLLILFSLFYPRQGEIWRLLDYACRLAIELGYHKEDGAVDMEYLTPNTNSSSLQLPEPAPEVLHRQKMLRRSTFWALYALERIMGQLFGRGSDIPESIITVEYPSPLHHDRPVSLAEAEEDEHRSLQAAAFAHHYRLVYLRSEIYRAMYLTATPSDHVLSLPWLCERYTTIHDWRNEFAVPDDFSGYATLTCIQGYNQTLCFMFQPLLMRELRSLSQPVESATAYSDRDTTDDTPVQRPKSKPEHVIVADSYEAACELLKAYQRIIREPPGSLLGSYPLTVLSAHYMWMATSTLIGHVLLALDGRVRTVWHFRNWKETQVDVAVGSREAHEVIDYSSFFEMSRVASTLLHWCVDRWPGMGGLLDVYEKLFTRLTKELVTKGLVS